jgi:hypothetical protein
VNTIKKKKKVFASPRILRATPSNCGNTLKLLTTKHKWKRLCGWGIMTSGMVITLKDDWNFKFKKNSIFLKEKFS